MEKPWFQNRTCLDIGCNEGMITLALASHFGTASMLGVDIDRSLTGKASRYDARPCLIPAYSQLQVPYKCHTTSSHSSFLFVSA